MIGMSAVTGKPLEGLDHLRQSIADILSTPIGTRVGRREYGSLLAELVDLDNRTDEEIAAEEVGGEGLAIIPAETWYRAVVRYRGRSLVLLRAAEAGGVWAVRAVVESWGLVWGRDVLDAPPPSTD